MARRYECANCGRDVRDFPDSERRFEGGKWYCSQSCLVSAESSSVSSLRKPSGPRRKWRRRIGWTLAIIVVLFAGLAALGAVLGSGTGTTGKKSLRTSRGGHPFLGSRLRPIPLRAAYTIPGSWRMQVTHVNRNAYNAVRNVKSSGQLDNHRPVKGSQNVLVSLVLKYVGGGSSLVRDVTNQVTLIGKHGAPYTNIDDACSPPNPLLTEQTIYSGQGTSGNLCFVIASNDASTLRLYVGSSILPGKPQPGDVWFALR